MFKYFKTGTYYINPVLKPWTHYGRFGRDQRVDGLLRALSTNQRLTTHSPTVHPPTSLVGVVRIVVPVRADLSDLIPKLEYLRAHDDEAKRIAQDGRDLALTMGSPR